MPGIAPSLTLAALEVKGLATLPFSPLRPPLKVPGAGKGRPVVAIPGMLTGDLAIRFLRRSLAASGFDARESGIGFHAVATPDSVTLVQATVVRAAQETGEKVALVGWSLGGLYARVIAQRIPHHVSAVMTLGSPFSGDPHANNAWRLYELLSGHPVTEPPFAERFDAKPPVPTVAVWSRRDGVISEENARGLPYESDLQVEVEVGHLQLATNAACVRRVITVLGEVLDQEG